jgi:hypothetical protein
MTIVGWLAALSLPILSAQDDDPVTVLMRFRDKVVQHATRVPNHTCVETIDRNRYEPALGRMRKSCDDILARRRLENFPSTLLLDTSDRLRLDVGLAGGREIYSWLGAARFEESEIDELIQEGAIGTGPFATFLLSLFESAHPRFSFDGEATIDGKPILEYSFTMPSNESHYKVRTLGRLAITGYTATLLVDPHTSELVRLSIRTEELPAASTLCELDTTLVYGMVPLSGIEYLLPVSTRQRFIQTDGREADNTIHFAACREFRGESNVQFDNTPLVVVSPVASARPAPPPLRFRAGLPVSVDIATAIDSNRAAAGDRIDGRLAKAIVDRGQTLVPAGARLEGRLMRVATRHSKPTEVTLAMRWETLELDGVNVPLSLLPNRRLLSKNTAPGGLRSRGVEFELPQPGDERYRVYRFPGEFLVLPSGYRTEWLTAE